MVGLPWQKGPGREPQRVLFSSRRRELLSQVQARAAAAASTDPGRTGFCQFGCVAGWLAAVALALETPNLPEAELSLLQRMMLMTQ